MDLIPTKRKEALPKGFSYPSGAEMISKALHGVPQYDQLKLTFCWRDTFWSSKYQARLKARGDIDIIELNPWGEWGIYVNAVPLVHAHAAREQLVSVGLENLRTYLSTPCGYAKDRRWKAVYDLSTNHCRFEQLV
jgi:hypothetical protein